ncbi:MAG: NMD3-related protein [Promethearchaeota archaeon]
MVKRFCSKCGKEIGIEDLEIYKKSFMCLECYYNKNPLLEIKDKYKLYVCPNCNALNFSGDPTNKMWEKNDEPSLPDKIAKGFFNTFLKEMSSLKNYSISLNVDKNTLIKSNENYINIIIEVKSNLNKETILKKGSQILIKKALCYSCMQQKGQRFSAVIQLRTVKLKHIKRKKSILDPILRDLITFSEELKNSKSNLFINEIKEEEEGYNIYLSNNTILKRLMNYIKDNYYTIVKISKKLIGKDSNTGNTLYRTYVLLRILPFSEQDRLRIRDKKYIITKIIANRIYLENLETGKNVVKPYRFFNNVLIELI